MGYCLNTDVYRIAGITTSEVASANVDTFIEAATAEVDRYTGTRWLFDAQTNTTGTATSGTTTTVVNTGVSWTTDEFNDDYALYIKSGTGIGQVRQITDTTTTSVSMSAWTTNPDSTSKYEIFYSPLENSTEDGNGTDTLFTKLHPLFSLQSLTINSTAITPTKVFQYKSEGRLTLSSTAEKSYFDSQTPQLINLTYYYGVRPDTRLKSLIKDFTASIAALMSLTAQIGGTFDDVTAYSFPEFSASKGEPYTNIREAWLKTDMRLRILRPLIPRYIQIG